MSVLAGSKTMCKLEERALIYTALFVLCSVASVLLDLTRGAWTFVQMAAVIELMYLPGSFFCDDSVRSQLIK